MMKWSKLAILTWILTASNLAFTATYMFDEPRFATDPFVPFYNYGVNETDDYKEDLETITKRFGKLSKEQSNPEVQTLLDEVYNGLKNQYPEFMANKVKPTFAIVENEDFGALAAYSSRLIKPHGIMVVPKGFITSKKSRCAKMGLIAHEMSHLMLHHNGIAVRSPIIEVQYANGQTMPETERVAATEYLSLARHIGNIRYSEANGMQLSSLSGTGFEDFIAALYEAKESACGTPLKKKLRGLAKNINSRYSEYRGDIQFETAKSRAFLNNTTSQMIQLIGRCTGSLGAEKNAVELAISQKETLIRAGIRHASLDFEAKPPTFAEYIELNKQVVNKMNLLASQFRLSQLRTVTTEDQADQMAVGLLVRLNCTPMDYIELFKDEIPKAKKQCEAQVKAGKEPPFGDLSDPHHSFCWRYDYFSKYAKLPKPGVEGLVPTPLKPLEIKPPKSVQ